MPLNFANIAVFLCACGSFVRQLLQLPRYIDVPWQVLSTWTAGVLDIFSSAHQTNLLRVTHLNFENTAILPVLLSSVQVCAANVFSLQDTLKFLVSCYLSGLQVCEK